MESLKEECPEMYHIIKFKLYEMINGPHFTKDLCEEAIKNTGSALQYVPKELRTEELCLEAVKDDGSVLYWVPNKTQEICEEAVKRYGSALRYVP